MRTHDVSADAKSSEALLKLVTEDIQWSQEMFLLLITAVCTDNGVEGSVGLLTNSPIPRDFS